MDEPHDTTTASEPPVGDAVVEATLLHGRMTGVLQSALRGLQAIYTREPIDLNDRFALATLRDSAKALYRLLDREIRERGQP